MTVREVRGGWGSPRPETGGGAGTGEPGEDEELDRHLVRICDLAGRPRGTGFAADESTVVTSHEAVDGLARVVLHTSDDRMSVVHADAVTALPGHDLALIQAPGLDLPPLPVTARESIPVGSYVRIAAGGWREARVRGRTAVTYTATDRFHLVAGAVELAVGTAGTDALRLGGHTAGGPVLDAATGAVLAVLGSALRSEEGGVGFAVSLREAAAAEPDGPLARLLARNAASVPAYGADLNTAGVLQLTATGTSVPTVGAVCVERPAVTAEFDAFLAGDAAVLALVGTPGSGRTTQLAALAAHRARTAPGLAAGTPHEEAPTLWLRGADLHGTDTSVADAVDRALNRAARILAATEDTGDRGRPPARAARRGNRQHRAPGKPGRGAHAARNGGPQGAGESPSGELTGRRPVPAAARAVPPAAARPHAASGAAAFGDISPRRVAGLARDAGRPLVLLLDGPEEMPAALAHRLAEWSEATAEWLRDSGARLVLACRPEHWEQAGVHHPVRLLHGLPGPGALPPCVRLGDLTEAEAAGLRALHGIPPGAVDPSAGRHPLSLGLLAQVRESVPGAPPAGRPGRDEIFAAYLDLLSLRIATRIAEVNGMPGDTVRRLAVRVSGRIHEAARSCLGEGEGALTRAGFEEVFPWRSGWAAAVLGEGLLVPAGEAYRFAHEEFGEWLQGTHLDLDAALGALVHRHRLRPTHGTTERVPAQRSRRGTRSDPADLPAAGLLTDAPPAQPAVVPRHRVGPVVEALLRLGRDSGPAELGRRLGELVHAADELQGATAQAAEAAWWAHRLFALTLTRLPDAQPQLGVLHLLTERIAGWQHAGRQLPGDFGPHWWAALALPEAERFDLLRRLVVADGAPGTGPRYLDTAGALLAGDPVGHQQHLTVWFTDERPLSGAPDATVAGAAQALLHTHRRLALDELVETLVDCAHPRADELLATLAEDEPSALCRAVDRWAHDERPARQVAAAAYGTRAAGHVSTTADRELLRHAALSLLAGTSDCSLHGPALALLVRDPLTRGHHLPEALRHFTAGDVRLPPADVLVALDSHPDQVLAACRTRLWGPAGEWDDAVAAELLRGLAEITDPAATRRIDTLVRDLAADRPHAFGAVAAYVDRRAEQGEAARALLLPLVTDLVRGHPAALRAALAGVLAAPGGAGSRRLRAELLDVLLTHEHDPQVLAAGLHALAHGAAVRGEGATRDPVHRTGLLLARTPRGSDRLEQDLVELGRTVPGFALMTTRWLAESPGTWSLLLGPGARRTLENLAAEPLPV